ncbi:MAG: MarR family transcriptional regulator [Bacteroidia bacterium]|nr:MarR family transcriptional regulator [Bacteroidia bacterium]
MEVDKSKEVPEQKFLNDWHEMRVNLLLSANWLEHKLKGFLEPFNLTFKQFNILRILRVHKEEPALSILDVRNRMIDKMSDTSRILTRLEQKGLSMREPCKQDKRTTRVNITQEGLDLLEKIDHSIPELDKMVMKLSPGDTRLLIQLLNELRS